MEDTQGNTLENTMVSKYTKEIFVDNTVACWSTDYLIFISQLALTFYLERKLNSTANKSKRIVLTLAIAQNIILGLSMGIGGIYHMTVTPETTMYNLKIVAHNFWWRFSNFFGSLLLIPQFLLPICCYYTPENEQNFFRKFTISSLVLSKVLFVYEWYTFNQLLTITFPACFLSTLIASLVMFGSDGYLKYKPNRWLLLSGGVAFILMSGFYIHLRGICGNDDKQKCPFAAWFNHNAFMHVGLIPILWLLGIGWAGSEDGKLGKVD